ncbi:MAG TPA: hypothetical protein VF471_13380 [Pseudoxanthomonas sp.]
MKTIRPIIGFSRITLFATTMLVAFPAVASDFTGFFTVFIGFPFLILLNLLLGFIVSCFAAQAGTNVKASMGGLFCLAGMLLLGNWISLVIGGARWYVFSVFVLLLAVLFYFLCCSPQPMQRRKAGIVIAKCVLAVAIVVGVLMLIDMISITSRHGDPGVLLYAAPLLFLLGVAFKTCSYIVRCGHKNDNNGVKAT